MRSFGLVRFWQLVVFLVAGAWTWTCRQVARLTSPRRDARSDAPAGPVRIAAREALTAYRNFDKVDRFAGGGFTLSTIVKLAGWAGLISILAVLVGRMREVESQLDPVTNGIARLSAQLEADRAILADATEQSRAGTARLAKEVQSVERQVGALQKTLARSAVVEDALVVAATQTQSANRELEDELSTEAEAQHVLEGRQKALTAALGTALDAAAHAGDSLHASAAELATRSAALDGELREAGVHAAALDHAIAALDPAGAQAAVSRADASAQALARALDQTAARAQALEARVEKAAVAERSAPVAAAPILKAAVVR